jgi:hypothetical protein
MNLIFMRNLFLIATLLFANAVAAQGPPEGRGGGTPDASSGQGSRGGRPLTDPRVRVAAVEARFREIGVEDLNLPPKRDYKIEMGEPQKVKLFRADPKLLENKFVAKLVLTPNQLQSHNLPVDDPRHSSDFPKEMGKLVALAATGSFLNRTHPTVSPVFKELAERCPADQLPDPALVQYLTSAEFDRDVRWAFGGHLNFSIFAPTEKEAAARVAAIIRLYDCGAARPLQQYFYAEGQSQLATARAGCDRFDKLTEEVRAEEEKVAQPSDVSIDILNQLKAQKIMVVVELAGLNARVKACESMLNDPKKLEVSTLQSISDMKVKAEIERIGTKEKLDQINSFIAGGDRREAINTNISKLGTHRVTVRREVSNATNTAEMYAHLVAYYSLQLEGNKVLINPVEWTEQ